MIAYTFLQTTDTIYVMLQPCETGNVLTFQSVKPTDIFKETWRHFSAILMVTEPGERDLLVVFVPKPNQTFRTALSQYNIENKVKSSLLVVLDLLKAE